jgi:hypothetical protein
MVSTTLGRTSQDPLTVPYNVFSAFTNLPAESTAFFIYAYSIMESKADTLRQQSLVI